MIKYDCGCEYENELQVVEKVLSKGFETRKLAQTFNLICECKTDVVMENNIAHCPNCQRIFAITPCNENDITKVVSVPKEYLN